MGEQRIQGNRNVQIKDVKQSLVKITYNETPRTVPLEPARVPVSEKLPSPARLVRAHSGVVPYVERSGLLTDLEGWIDGPEPFAGHVIEGRGGAGKTKLGVKLCEEVRKSRWLCGFLSRIADQGMLDALVQTPTARLVIIDYAENRAEQVEILLPLLSAAATATEPVRVLLLVRTGPDQVSNWPKRLGSRMDALDATLEGCEVQTLEDTPLLKKDREDLFEVAGDAFAKRLGAPAPPARPPDLEEAVFANPLMVVIAAYLAAHGQEAPATRSELLDEVLAHERRYWRESLGELSADDALLERVVALATLVNVETEATATELLRLISDLCDASVERRSRLARWVHDQYPGPRWWNPLEPDLVGEHLVARCFTDTPETLRGSVESSKPEEITRPLEVLARASADHLDLALTLRPILGEELQRLCEIAVAQAEGVKDGNLLYGGAVTVAAAIDAAISAVKIDPMVFPDAAELMPPRRDVVLSHLAARLTAGAVEAFRPLAAADADFKPLLAGVLNNLANRFGDLGRHEEALAAAQESVEIRRPLAVVDEAAYGHSLAMALNNLANCLGNSGRHEEALAAAQESVEIRRPVAAANIAVYGSGLAGALSNLASRLGKLGRHEEALTAAEESVETYRPLAAANPAVYDSELSMALNNFGNRLGSVGRHEEALAAVEESVEIRRPLAAANAAAYQPDLAMTLHNLGNRLGNLGRHEEALAAAQESVETYRPLVAADAAAFGSDLAMALNNLSSRLGNLGRHEEALAAAQESVESYRFLAAANAAAYLPNLAMALNNLASSLSDLGRHDEALAAAQESVEIRRPLAAANATVYGSELTRSLHNLALRLYDNGRDKDAEDIRREAELIAVPPVEKGNG